MEISDLLLTSSDHELQFHIATQSSDQELQFHMVTPISSLRMAI